MGSYYDAFLSLLVLISSTKSKTSLVAHTILTCTVMTASGSPEHHHGKQRLIKKDLCGISSSYGLKITIKANNNAVNFLDVTLNLCDGKYMAYTKLGNTPLCVNRKPNHPPRIFENITKFINKWLFEISIDENSFNQSAPLYHKALGDHGYHHRLTFSPITNI